MPVLAGPITRIVRLRRMMVTPVGVCLLVNTRKGKRLRQHTVGYIFCSEKRSGLLCLSLNQPPSGGFFMGEICHQEPQKHAGHVAVGQQRLIPVVTAMRIRVRAGRVTSLDRLATSAGMARTGRSSDHLSLLETKGCVRDVCREV